MIRFWRTSPNPSITDNTTIKAHIDNDIAIIENTELIGMEALCFLASKKFMQTDSSSWMFFNIL